MDHRIVGLQMLAVLIQDIQTSGTNTPVRSAQYRKAGKLVVIS